MFKQYNPKLVAANWNLIPFDGAMDGEFYTLEYDEDAVTKHVGSQGDVTAVVNANAGASFTAILIPGSPTNNKLSALVANARRGTLPTGVFTLKDLNGTTLITAKDAWIKKWPKLGYAKDLSPREWVIDLAEVQVSIIGGQGI